MKYVAELKIAYKLYSTVFTYRLLKKKKNWTSLSPSVGSGWPANLFTTVKLMVSERTHFLNAKRTFLDGISKFR